MPVHNIHMNPIGTGSLGFMDLFSQAGEIG
jgi:hypothetical protein